MNYLEKGSRLHKMAQSYFISIIKLLELEIQHKDERDFSVVLSSFEFSFLSEKNNPFSATPVLSLMRLAFELMLKSIHYHIRSCGFEVPIFKNIEKTHDLNALYTQLLEIEPQINNFSEVCNKHSKNLYVAYIQLLANFTTYDPKGDIFRFGFNKAGTPLKIFEKFSDYKVAESYILLIHKANEIMCRTNTFLKKLLNSH